MALRSKTDWNLLAKHLAGETSESENAKVDIWISSDTENRALFGKLKQDWKIMNTMNKQFNVDNAWNKLHGRITTHDSISGTETAAIRKMPKPGIWFTPVRIAASLLLIAVLGFSLVTLSRNSRNITVNTASDERQRSVLLPDGTKVLLNADTRMNYAKAFGRKGREVFLTGEAFFEVTPDKDKPFLIHADHADVRVIGTSFNINTLNSKREVDVYVSTGIVELFESGKSMDHVLLHPGDIGTAGPDGIKSVKSKNENSIAWKTGSMDFQETRLSEAIEVLNKLYRVNIVCLDEELNNKQTNGTYIYPEEPLDTILAVFCKQNYLKIEKSDNKIYLSR